MMACVRWAALLALAPLVLGAAAPANATPAAAPRLTASQPAQGAIIAKPKVITLTFSDAMAPAQTLVSVVMTAMPGMDDHGEMLIRNFTPTWSNANRTLSLALRQPLTPGSYDVRWQGKSSAGQAVKGLISFQVR